MPEVESSVLAFALGILAVTLTILVLIMAALLDRSGPIRIRHWVENAGGELRRLFDRSERFEAYRFLLGFLARGAPALLTALLALLLAPSFGVVEGGLVSILTALLVVMIAEVVSRLMARDAERSLDRLTPFYRAARMLFRPFLPLASPLFAAGNGLEVNFDTDLEDEASEDEIEAFLDVGTKEGILEPGEDEIILRVIDFGDEVVRGVMTPRIDMVCAPIDTGLDDLAELFLSSNHSRIPLYEGSVDQIRGVLHIRDLLKALRAEAPPKANTLIMPPHFVPETKPLTQLLSELQARHVHMALVVDEYGGTAGLVTIEDLLEEIVGEIVDEHDEEEPEAERLPDGGYRLEGMTSLDVLGSLFDRDFASEPYETVGGMVFGLLGDLPEVGSSVSTHGLRFTVERVDDRRVEMLLVTNDRQISSVENDVEEAK
jgi:CBS domain containing-hemolysin-like protein